jgi:pimeloyl-ACP methyl ester carboxylesterase
MDNLDLSSFTSRKEIDESLSKEIKNISLRQFLIKNIHRNKEGNFSWKINVPVLKKYLPLIMRDVRADFFAGYKPLNKYRVTFIRGLKSNYIRDEDISGIKSIYPQSQIIDIPGAGHWLHSEKPDEFVRAVLSAVQRTD